MSICFTSTARYGYGVGIHGSSHSLCGAARFLPAADWLTGSVRPVDVGTSLAANTFSTMHSIHQFHSHCHSHSHSAAHSQNSFARSSWSFSPLSCGALRRTRIYHETTAGVSRPFPRLRIVPHSLPLNTDSSSYRNSSQFVRLRASEIDQRFVAERFGRCSFSSAAPKPDESTSTLSAAAHVSSVSSTTAASTASSLNGQESSIVLPSNASMLMELMKARLNAGVAITAYLGFCASINSLFLLCSATGFFVIFGTFCTGAAAAIWNELMEMKQDAVMKRTRSKRPLAIYHRLSEEKKSTALFTPARAAALSSALFTTGLTSLYLFTSLESTIIAAVTAFLYAPIYTFLKRYTTWNTPIGAIVGALPPVLGYFSCLGPHSLWAAFCLFSALYLWQFLHFHVIALLYSRDYRAAGFKMLAVLDRQKCIRSIYRSSWALAFVPFAVFPYVSLPVLIFTASLSFYVRHHLNRVFAAVDESEYKEATGYVFALLGAYIVLLLGAISLMINDTADLWQASVPYLGQINQRLRHGVAQMLLALPFWTSLKSFPVFQSMNDRLEQVFRDSLPTLTAEESVRKLRSIEAHMEIVQILKEEREKERLEEEEEKQKRIQDTRE